MKILVFDNIISGHHIEYLHHLNMGAANRKGIELLFVLPKSFQTVRENYVWDEITSRFVFFDDVEKIEEGKGFLAIIKKSNRLSRLLKKYIEEYKPDAVFLNMMVYFMPVLPFLLRSKPAIYGIIYKIYLYRWHKLSILQRIQNVFVHYLYSRFKCIGGVFVLNDKSSAQYLNRLYHTNKYIYLPDPFNEQSYIGGNIRGKLKIKENDKVYLHFGSLASRKGSSEILDALLLADKEELNDKVFVFAGLVNKDIKDQFYTSLSLLKGKCRIHVIEEFCSNELIADLCSSSDYILCPYKESDLSSGVLGYAAFYKKPVIAPQSGVIGKLIKKYALGLTINQITPEQIWNAIRVVEKIDYRPKEYIDTVRIEEFNRIVLESIESGNSK